MRRRHLESVSAALYGSTFQHLLKSPIRIQPQLSGKGVLGHSPKCVLPTFAHTKVGPRRAGVQAVTLRRLRYADRRPQTIPCRVGIQILISKRPRPAVRRSPAWPKNLLPAFLHRRVTPRRAGVLPKPCTRPHPPPGDYQLGLEFLLLPIPRQIVVPAPARRDPSPLQNIIIIPSLTSPIKPTIYAILAQ